MFRGLGFRVDVSGCRVYFKKKIGFRIDGLGIRVRISKRNRV